MNTLEDIIVMAFQDLAIYAPSESITEADHDRAMASLNQILDPGMGDPPSANSSLMIPSRRAAQIQKELVAALAPAYGVKIKDPNHG